MDIEFSLFSLKSMEIEEKSYQFSCQSEVHLQDAPFSNYQDYTESEYGAWIEKQAELYLLFMEHCEGSICDAVKKSAHYEFLGKNG
jgi:hypothetical protein